MSIIASGLATIAALTGLVLTSVYFTGDLPPLHYKYALFALVPGVTMYLLGPELVLKGARKAGIL